ATVSRTALCPLYAPAQHPQVSARHASRPSLTRNQTIASEVTASIHQAPSASCASSPSTATQDSQPLDSRARPQNIEDSPSRACLVIAWPKPEALIVAPARL